MKRKDALTVREAQAVLLKEARRLHQEQLGRDGQLLEIHVYDPANRAVGSTVQVRMYANGTWEYA